MDWLSTVETIVSYLLIFIGVLTVALVVLIVIIFRLPSGSPLKRILTSLSFRIAATLIASLFAIPIEEIPGIDLLYDLSAPIALLWYWFTFARDAYSGRATRSGAASTPVSKAIK
jgi:hypothetical protein